MSKQPPKKKLLVKTDEIIAEPVNNLAEVEIPQEPIPQVQNVEASVEAPKIDKRGKHPNIMSNLEKGRIKLAEIRAQNKLVKEALTEKAFNKKVALQEKKKTAIMDAYGVDSLSTDEEEEVAPPSKAKPVKVAPKKKKPIRYVEEPESSEEEVVYVKRGVAPKAPKQQPPALLFY
tara:strand:- start:638 stop:1162 length:525 start_codon:yes stop_codon:yes gene_type:complete